MASKFTQNTLRRLMREDAIAQPISPEEEEAMFGGLDTVSFREVKKFADNIQTKRIQQDKIEFRSEWEKLTQTCFSDDLRTPEAQKRAGSACADLIDVALMFRSMGKQDEITTQVDTKLALERSCLFGELHHCVPYEKVSGNKTAAKTRLPEVTEQCRDGDANACFSVFAYISATATSWDRSRKRAQAAPYLQRACKLGHASACGLNFMERQGDRESTKMIEDCCLVRGNSECCQMAFENSMTQGKLDEVFSFAEPACTSCTPGPMSPSFFIAISYSGLAEKYGQGEFARSLDKKKTIDIVTTSCRDCEDSQSCAFLGAITERGWGGLKRDKTAAQSHYIKSCENGLFMGCVLAFEMQMQGKTSDLYSLE